MEKLIIIRGPSGAGKSSVAKELHARCSRPTLLISEDKVRCMFSDWKQPNHTASKKLATSMVISGLKSNYDVIYEGISNIKNYEQYYKKIFAEHPTDNYMFYLDVGFDETVRRHDGRPEKAEFGIDMMKEWWDYATPTGYDFETIINEGTTLEDTVEIIGRVAILELK
jgi:adenylate kinase family enzyme